MSELKARQKAAITTIGVVTVAIASFAGATFGRAKGPTARHSPDALVVDIGGAVKKPGVVTLARGARLQDAIDEAGGLRRDANTDSLSLSERVRDGKKYYVPTEADEVALPAMSFSPEPRMPSRTVAAPAQPVNINTATQAELETLPGIGPAMATRILQLRVQLGSFQNLEQLNDVKGIGPKTLAKLRPYLLL